jgi:choline-sulfatase
MVRVWVVIQTRMLFASIRYNLMSNVIVFMSDEHNPRYSSPYGHTFLQTPNMQRLADSGAQFAHVYCPSPLCVPSRSDRF